LVKLPEPPDPAGLRDTPPEITVLTADAELWRVYFRGGCYPSTWDKFRSFGPAAGGRFDHHDEPPGEQERRILYAATSTEAATTCLAEVFQERRSVNVRRDEPWLACFSLAGDVALLDLTGRWPTRAGASMAINSGPRPRTRRWSRAIYAAYPEIQGLLYASSMNAGRPAVALYERAGDALPTNTIFNEPLSHPVVLPALRRVASDLGYGLIP